jgi:hypothetical protein
MVDSHEAVIEALRGENAQMQAVLKECARVLPALVSIAKEADYPDNLAEVRAGRAAAAMALSVLKAPTDSRLSEEALSADKP